MEYERHPDLDTLRGRMVNYLILFAYMGAWFVVAWFVVHWIHDRMGPLMAM